MANGTDIKKYMGLKAVERLIENIKVELGKKQDSGLCVAINQGVEYTGKYLGIDGAGKVVPTTLPDSGGNGIPGIIKWGDLVSENAYLWGNMNGTIVK